MVQVVPGIYQVTKGFVGAYLVESDDGLIMVDCGVPKDADRITAAIAEMGRTLGEVNHILVTHQHPDHIGGLSRLAERSEATVYAHTADAPVVRGDEPYVWPEWRGPVARLIGPLMRATNPGSAEPTPGVQELVGGEELPFAGGLKVLHTPGHTAGHLSFLIERSPRMLIVGDAAVNIGGVRPSIGRLAEIATADQTKAAESFRMLAALEFEAAVFGHGKPITTGAGDRFRAAAVRYCRSDKGSGSGR